MRFVYATKGNVPDVVKTFPDGKVHRIFTDQLGTPRVVWDVAANAPLEVLDFDEWGIKLSDSNATFELPFGFAGGLYDADTKLTRFGARDYDASVGRWVSKDPILFGGGQANLYAYVGSDPVNLTDPSGLAPKDKLWGLPKRFWRWYHRKYKQPGDPDLGKDEARALCDEWEEMGKPGPDNRGGGDDFDFLPGPVALDFCSLFSQEVLLYMPWCRQEA